MHTARRIGLLGGALVLTLLVSALLGAIGAVAFGYGVGAVMHSFWPLDPLEAAGPQNARGMMMIALGAVGFLGGWSAGLLTGRANWRRAKQILGEVK